MSAPRAARSSLSHARPASTLLLVVLLFAFFMLFLMYLYAKAKKCVPGALVAQGARGRFCRGSGAESASAQGGPHTLLGCPVSGRGGVD